MTRQTYLHLHFSMTELHLIAFFKTLAFSALMDVDGQFGNIMEGVFFEILAVHIFEVECQVLAVAEVALNSIFVLILDEFYCCP